MPNPRRQDRELDALYATLPELKCQGLCHDSCGPIDMSVRERARIVERARKPVTCGTGASCSMLTDDRRCSVYEIRPMICRLWGLVKRMRCPYGCVPAPGFLSDGEAVRLLAKAQQIGGAPEGAAMDRIVDEVAASLTDAQAVAIMHELDERVRKAHGADIYLPAPTLHGRADTMRRSSVGSPFEP